jgi:hypothetical protein
MKTKTFDAVEFKNEMQKKVNEILRHKSNKEIIKYFSKKYENLVNQKKTFIVNNKRGKNK